MAGLQGRVAFVTGAGTNTVSIVDGESRTVTRTIAVGESPRSIAVDPDSLPANCRVTELNLNDGTVESFAVDGRPVLSVQYHPEAAPGPHESGRLFDRFLSSLPAARRA